MRKTEHREENQKENFIPNMQIEGRRAVQEALTHGKAIDRLFLRKETDGDFAGSLKIIAAKAKQAGIVISAVDKRKLDGMTQTGNHQGVIAVCPQIEYSSIPEILDLAKNKKEPPFIIIVDGITDPHNLGAIIRSAHAGGAHGVIIPKRRATGLTAVVSKASAGALLHMLIARATNINAAILELKKAGLWVVGSDASGKVNLFEARLDGALALVIGSEGGGVGRLALSRCDEIVRIPMKGKIASLNASVAAALLIYEYARKARF